MICHTGHICTFSPLFASACSWLRICSGQTHNNDWCKINSKILHDPFMTDHSPFSIIYFKMLYLYPWEAQWFDTIFTKSKNSSVIIREPKFLLHPLSFFRTQWALLDRDYIFDLGATLYIMNRYYLCTP